MAAISAHPAQAMVNNSTNCTKSVIYSINRLSTGQNQRILLKQVSSWPWSTKSIVASPFFNIKLFVNACTSAAPRAFTYKHAFEKLYNYLHGGRAGR